MADAVGLIGLVQGAQAPAGSVVSAQTAPPVSTATPSLPGPSTAPAISPRIVVDPFAGAITQFLGSDGQVETQIPSTVAVAYLRAGLQANGQVKESQSDLTATVA